MDTDNFKFTFKSRMFWIRETDVLEYTGVDYGDSGDEDYVIYERRLPSKKVRNIHNLPQGWVRVELVQLKESFVKMENYYGVLREKVVETTKLVHIARIVAEVFLEIPIDDEAKAVRYIDSSKAPMPNNLEIVFL